jgi:hypothetical protein
MNGVLSRVHARTTTAGWFFFLTLGFVPFYSPFVEAAERKWKIDLGLSYTHIDYQETSALQIQMTEEVLTGKAGLRYMMGKRWEMGVSGFSTVTVLAANATPSGISEAKWMGLNSRLGYRLIDTPKSVWTLSGGWYLWTMSTQAAAAHPAYGVSYAVGPQAYLSGWMSTQSKSAWSYYAKYAWIGTGAADRGGKEIASGVGYTPVFKKGKPQFQFLFDLSYTKYVFFKLTTASLGVGYSW